MSKSETTALKPCPFCGDADHLEIRHSEGTILHPHYYVHCDRCGAQTGGTDTGEHIEQWNSRHEDLRAINKTNMPCWIEHNPTSYSLMFGRVELAQVDLGRASKEWFYNLRFTVAGERASYSCPTLPEAKIVCADHARKILEACANGAPSKRQ